MQDLQKLLEVLWLHRGVDGKGGDETLRSGTLWCIRHYKAEWSEWGGSRRLEISTDLSVLDSFVRLFLSSVASCDTGGMIMNITGALMSVMNSRQKRLWIIWFLPPDFRLILVVGFCAGAKQGMLTAGLMIEDLHLSVKTVVACYGLRVLLFLAFICDSWELGTEVASQNLKKAIFTSTVKVGRH